MMCYLLARVSGFCYRRTDLRLSNPASLTEAAMGRLPFFLVFLLLCTSCWKPMGSRS